MPVLFPSQTWQIIPAQQIAGLLEQRVLFVGQMTASGSATSGDLVTDIGNSAEEDTLFGRRSHLAGMIREFKKLNERTQVDAIPLDDAIGTAATSTITATGTSATADARIYVTFGSEKAHRKAVDITSGDDIANVAAAIATAFATDLDSPFEVTSSLGVATALAPHDGTLANEWSTKIEGTIPGITLTIAGWSGGATDPTLTGVLDVIGDIRYQTIVWPSNYDATVVEDVLNARFNASYQILDGVAIQTKKGTLATLKAYADQNSQSLCVLGNKTVADTARLVGTAVVEMPDIVSSQFAAFRSLKFTDEAPLATYLSTVAALDQFGGIALGALPYPNTLMPNLTVPDPRDEFTLAEMDELADNAVSVLSANRAYNSTILGTMVTTYLTNGAGNPDTSFKFLETVDQASLAREFFYENFRSRYSQTRLTDGDLIAGRDMANESSIRAFCGLLYDELAEDAIFQSGTAAKKDFFQNLVVSVNVSTGTVTVNMAPLLVSQLRVVLGTIQINFGA
jgi:phage tail sheath gpL-like